MKFQDVELLKSNPKISESDKELIRWRNADRLFHSALVAGHSIRLFMAIPERYNTGYNIGVGGAVVRGGQLLLVRRASRHGRGNWQLPGGFIEPDETIEQAVVREVQEEAGVTAEVEAVLGLRSRYDPDSGNGIYVVLFEAGQRRAHG